MKSAVGTVSRIIFESGKKQIIELRNKQDSIQVLFNDANLHVEQHDHICVRCEILNSKT
tara:strand:- start:3411 stop:3587 length:177 start_codon:yes stop_codon:yes gene_type:complete